MKKKRVLLVIEPSRAYGRGIIQGVSNYVHEIGNWTILSSDRRNVPQKYRTINQVGRKPGKLVSI